MIGVGVDDGVRTAGDCVWVCVRGMVRPVVSPPFFDWLFVVYILVLVYAGEKRGAKAGVGRTTSLG